jgi:hypothetical protein
MASAWKRDFASLTMFVYGNALPREGVQTGRAGYFDLLAETYWGGILYVLALITLLTMAAFCMYFTLVAAASTPY